MFLGCFEPQPRRDIAPMFVPPSFMAVCGGWWQIAVICNEKFCFHRLSWPLHEGGPVSGFRRILIHVFAKVYPKNIHLFLLCHQHIACVRASGQVRDNFEM
jgi:hypothetical protein